MALNPGYVQEGKYYYDGHLKVNPGNDYYHERAAPTEVYRLLRERRTDRDREWHFYVAQLIHYSLPCSDDLKHKPTAKDRLNEAIKDNTLHVPEDIYRLEVRLKQQFEDKKRKAWLAGRRNINAAEPARTPKRSKATVKSKDTVADACGHGCNVTGRSMKCNSMFTYSLKHSQQQFLQPQQRTALLEWSKPLPQGSSRSSPSKYRRGSSLAYTPCKGRSSPRKAASRRARYTNDSSSSEAEMDSDHVSVHDPEDDQ